MTSSRRHRPHPKPAWQRALIWVSASLVILLLIGFFLVRLWIDAYLRGDAFRTFVGKRTGETMHAEAQFAPFQFTGLNVYSDGLEAHGSERAAFSQLHIEQIRAELSFRRWREHVWEIERFEAQRMNVAIDGSRVVLPEITEASEKGPQLPGTGWLPNRVEIGSATIRNLQLTWGADPHPKGALRGAALAISPTDGGWTIQGSGGQLIQSGLPSMDVSGLRVVYRPPSLFVQGVVLRQGTNGRIEVNGEINLEDKVDLRTTVSDLDLSPFLNDDWRVRLHGYLSGEFRTQATLPASAPPTFSGKFTLSQGSLEALPVLEEIASSTRLQQYRHLTISRCSGEFLQDHDQLHVTNIVVESVGLIRLDGSFSVVGGMINGSFQVGVAPSSLQWIPGSQERVFTDAHDGYLWTPMRVTGPLSNPEEDLSPRLRTAAKEAVINKVESTMKDATKTGTDALKGAVDLLLPLVK